MSIFFQALIVIVVIATMILILLGIGQLVNPGSFDNEDETLGLRSELDESEEVISHNNMFNKLINEDNRKVDVLYKRVDKDNSNDPSSRKL